MINGNWIPSNLRSHLRSPSCGGIVDVSLLDHKKKLWRFDNLPTLEEIVPVNELSDKSIVINLFML